MTQDKIPHGIVIIGGGPAGLLLSKYLENNNVSNQVIDPVAHLHCTYGIWQDEVAPWAYSLLEASASHTFEHMIVKNDVTCITKKRRYWLLDNEKFLRNLSIQPIRASVVSIDKLPCEPFKPCEFILHLSKQNDNTAQNSQDPQYPTTIHASIVIDATGSQSTFQQYPLFNPSYQSFYGAYVKLDSPHSLPLTTMELMDFTTTNSNEKTDDKQPSFCYTMPIDATTVFMEETILNGPKMRTAVLKHRLVNRIKTRFPQSAMTLTNIESNNILMNCPQPLYNSIVPMGAAAGMICPHTGYMVGFVTHAVKQLGDALVTKHLHHDHHDGIHRYLFQQIINHSHQAKLLAGMALTTFSRKDLASFMTCVFSMNDADFFRLFQHGRGKWAFRQSQLMLVFKLPIIVTLRLVMNYIRVLYQSRSMATKVPPMKLYSSPKTLEAKPKRTLEARQKRTFVVIGGGVSGLSCACYLAKHFSNQGRVIVLDKNPTMGGRMTLLHSPCGRFRFDKGPSWLWMPDIWSDFFGDFNIDMKDMLLFEPLDPQYRMYFNHDRYIDVPSMTPYVATQYVHSNKSSLNKSIQEFINKLKIRTLENDESFKNNCIIDDASKQGIVKILNDSFDQYSVMLMAIRKNVLNVFALATWNLLKSIRFRHLIVNQETVINQHVRHECLQKLLAWPVLFVGGQPKDVPYLFNLLNYSATLQGTHYPRRVSRTPIDNTRVQSDHIRVPSGMYCLTEAMTDVARKMGVELRNNCTVTGCTTLNNTIDAIQYTELNEPKEIKLSFENHSNLPSDVVVMSGDYHNFDQNVLKEPWREYTAEYWDKVTMGPTCVLLYLGLDFSHHPEQQKRLHIIPHHTLFFDTDMDAHLGECYKNHGTVAEPMFYVNRTTAKDSTVAPKDCETMFILIPISPNGPSSQSYTKQLVHYVREHLSKYLKFELWDRVVFEHVYDKEQFVQDYFSFKGNAYGSAMILSQFASMRPRMQSSKLSNLYYTGQLTYPGGGLPTCLASGRLVVDLVRRHITDNSSRTKSSNVPHNIGVSITDAMVRFLQKMQS